MKQYITGEAKDNALFIYCTARLLTNLPTYLFISQDTTTLLILHLLLSDMSQSSSFSGALKPNYNKHFPRSFLLNYGMALENLPDDKVLARLKDWNCEWLSRPNIAMSEFASTIKDNLPLIQQIKGTIFVPSFVEDLEQVVTPLIPQMQRLDNKDRATNAPPTQEDLLDVLEGDNDKKEVEDLFVDAINAAGLLLMMAIQTMAINTLLHNPTEFVSQALRCPATETFKEDPTDQNMMSYPLDGILMRRRSVQRTRSLWDLLRYQGNNDQEDEQKRPSRPGQRLDDSNADGNRRRRPATTSATPRSRLRVSATLTGRSTSTSTMSGRRASTSTATLPSSSTSTA